MRSLLLALALAATPALAQDAPPLVDLAALSLDAVTPADEAIEVAVAGDPPTPIGAVTIRASLAGDVLTVVQVVDVPQAGPPRTDSTRMAWPALTPLSDAFAAGDEAGTVAYGEGTISGAYGRVGQPLPFAFETDGPRYPAAVLPYLVRALPFEPGLAVTVPVFAAKERFRDATLEVTGRDVALRPDGTEVEAWTVRQVGGGGVTGMFPQTHFVDPETRRLLKTTMSVQGTPIVMTPVSDDAPGSADAAPEPPAPDGPQIGPGDPALAVDRLADDDATLAVHLVQPSTQRIGGETRRLTVDEAAGTVTLETMTMIPMAGQELSATYVAAYPSLEAISLREENNGDVTELAFADGRVTGTDEGAPVDAALDAPVFVNGFQPVLVTLLPLAEGYAATLRGYSSGEGVVEVAVAVVGQETVEGRAVWLVEADRADAPTITFRVDAETHALVGYGLSPQPGVRVEVAREAD